MSGMISREALDRLRLRYPAGTRVELIQMIDPYSKLKPGDRGSVRFVDDIGSIHVAWDCGSSLGLVWNEDLYKVVETDRL